MRYEILRADSTKELEKKVNEAILMGGKPLGGVAVHSDGYMGKDTRYYQAFLFD